MKRILKTTLLACLSVSHAAFGGIGDTYYCDVVEHVTYEKDAIQRYKPDRFTFRWNKNEIVFGKGGYFADSTAPISSDWSARNIFSGGKDHERLFFFDGRLRYVSAFFGTKEQADKMGFHEMRTIIADCSKFND